MHFSISLLSKIKVVNLKPIFPISPSRFFSIVVLGCFWFFAFTGIVWSPQLERNESTPSCAIPQGRSHLRWALKNGLDFNRWKQL